LIDPNELRKAQLTHLCFSEKTDCVAVCLRPDCLHLPTVALPLPADKKYRTMPTVARLLVNKHSRRPERLRFKNVKDLIAQLEFVRT
jgi:hypothetical protein